MDPILADLMVRQRHDELAEIKRQSRPQYAQYGVNWLLIDRPRRDGLAREARSLLPRLVARLSGPREATQW